jgi:hypothetical protein
MRPECSAVRVDRQGRLGRLSHGASRVRHPRILKLYDLPAVANLREDHGWPRLVLTERGPDVGYDAKEDARVPYNDLLV